MEEYQRRRLVMLDHDANLIGPPPLGFDWEDFNRRRNRRYHFVIGDRPRTRLRTTEFETMVKDPVFSAVLEHARTRARNDRKAGMAFLGGGAGALATGVVFNSLGVSESDLSPVLFGGIPLLASGITFLVIGASLQRQSRKRAREIRGFDFEEILPRDRAWTSMQLYNGELRRELGLPDDEALDGVDEDALAD